MRDYVDVDRFARQVVLFVSMLYSTRLAQAEEVKDYEFDVRARGGRCIKTAGEAGVFFSEIHSDSGL